MGKYNKAISATIMGLATMVFATWGDQMGLPADWPEMVTALLTPVVVYFVPNSDKPEIPDA